jgi:multisubunit Na+/H+ antiporter MnhB subunit
VSPFWERLPFWLYLLTLMPFALCLFFYGTRSPWQQSQTGRALISLLTSLVAVLLWAVVAQVAEIPREVLDAMRAVLLGGVFLSGCVLLRNILLLQRERSDASAHPRRRVTDR